MEKLKEMRDFYAKFFNQFGDEWLVRNGNEYDVANVNFYFPDYKTMTITYKEFEVSLEERGENDYVISFAGDIDKAEALYKWVWEKEALIVTVLQEQMSKQLIFGAQLIQEDWREEAIADAKEIANEEI